MFALKVILKWKGRGGWICIPKFIQAWVCTSRISFLPMSSLTWLNFNAHNYQFTGKVKLWSRNNVIKPYQFYMKGETNFTKKMSITQVTIKHHWRISVTILQVKYWRINSGKIARHWTAEIKNKLQQEQLANTDGLSMIRFIWSFKLYKVSICSTLSAHHKTVDESVGLPRAHLDIQFKFDPSH